MIATMLSLAFLNPLLLWAVPLCAVPIVIHLLNRRRFQRVPWAAMDFLLKAMKGRLEQAVHSELDTLFAEPPAKASKAAAKPEKAVEKPAAKTTKPAAKAATRKPAAKPAAKR